MRHVDVRSQTAIEELANTLIHAVALIFIMVVASITWPLAHSSSSHVTPAAAAIYLVTMVMLYAASALYHGLPPGRTKQLFMKLDYCAIYLFIAGSYTPFGAGILSGHGGIGLLVAIWTLAVAGVVLQVFGKPIHPFLSTGFYLAMGWTVLAVARPLSRLLPAMGLT